MRVAIVGAGICGLYLALKLAEKEHEVIVFEKKEKIGKEVCSGLFSERIFDFIPKSRSLIHNNIGEVLINFPKKTLRLKFSRKFYVIDHADLDRLVASLAENSGAKIILNSYINVVPEGFDRVIGCDGAMSQVRKNLKTKDNSLKNPEFRLGMQGFLKEDGFSNTVETWATKFGFLWKIPRESEIEYGIIEKPENCPKIFEEFLRRNNIQLENKKSAPIPQGFSIPRHPLITLCGDAAGLTKPWSGGGVIWGLQAADILLKNFPDFLKYQKEAKKALLNKIIFSKIATKTVYFLGFKMPWILPKNPKIDGDFLKYAK